MRAAETSTRVRLRLDRQQRARADDIPTLTVLVGDRAAARGVWESWLRPHGRACVELRLDEGSGPMAPRLAVAVARGRSPLEDAASFVARHTTEPLNELPGRMRVQGRPERAALLERVATRCGLPQSAQLADALLSVGPEVALADADSSTVVALLQLIGLDRCPALLVVTAYPERAVPLLHALIEQVPVVPMALSLEPQVLQRWSCRASSAREQAIVREGLIALDDRAPQRVPEASPEPVPQREPEASPEPSSSSPLREQLVALSQGPRRDDPAVIDQARSLAERILFEALQAHPVTRGRFELNARMPFGFGPRPAEIDLLSRRDRVAVEVDGYYHFVDADAYRRDRRKDVLLQRHGLFVVRVLADDVAHALESILDRIVDVLHRPAPGVS